MASSAQDGFFTGVLHSGFCLRVLCPCLSERTVTCSVLIAWPSPSFPSLGLDHAGGVFASACGPSPPSLLASLSPSCRELLSRRGGAQCCPQRAISSSCCASSQAPCVALACACELDRPPEPAGFSPRLGNSAGGAGEGRRWGSVVQPPGPLWGPASACGPGWFGPSLCKVLLETLLSCQWQWGLQRLLPEGGELRLGVAVLGSASV